MAGIEIVEREAGLLDCGAAFIEDPSDELATRDFGPSILEHPVKGRGGCTLAPRQVRVA
jgi:hypothetical protein